MLTSETNDRLTRVGKGTPMGELMRRYWHPVAPTAELDERPTKSVRLLGEDLVLYKDRKGTYGLIDALCPHRRVDMSYGIPEEEGLRCMYHGWMFDETGQCVEQPFEETVHPDGHFKEKVKIDAYPVEGLGGMLWAYLGPTPAPLLPRWDLFVWDNVLRDIGKTELNCNWLQCMENSLDPVHLEWLHGYWSEYMLKEAGTDGVPTAPWRRHTKISFEPFEHGIIKRRVYTDTTEDDPEWKNGHPVVFPNWLRVGSNFQMRTPVDDTHTIHWHYDVYAPPAGVAAPKQDVVPYYDAPLRQDDGSFAVDYIIGQDTMAWVTQGPIAQRQLEKLGESDKGIILYRRMLLEEIAKVEAGEEPRNVFRDPGANEIIELFQERKAGVIMKLPPNTVPLPGQWDPATGDISVAPTGKHAPVGLRARTTYQAAAAAAGINLD
jgi:5,5'-dehydrodivanillate O-demethylase oxygenase subunit